MNASDSHQVTFNVVLPCCPAGTPPPQQQLDTNGCPAGWLPAVGTLYDSWPKPGTTECTAYSGCYWAGMFSRVSPGPMSFASGSRTCTNACHTARDGSRAQWLDGGDGSFCCRWPEATVRNWAMGSTWDRDPALLGRRLEVMVAGRTTRTVSINMQDVCADSDCSGCCSRNTGSGRWKLIDIEKWPASSLLGFDTSSSSFDINTVAKPSTSYSRAGTPAGLLPLCYRDVGAAPQL